MRYSAAPRLLLVAAWLLGGAAGRAAARGGAGAAAAAAAQTLACPEVCSCYVRDERLHTDCSGRGLTDLPPGISFEGTTLRIDDHIGILGVDLTHDLNFARHIEDKAKLPSKKLGVLNKVQVLDLSNNIFDYYPEDLKFLQQIEIISFVGNQLSVPLPQYFANFGKLQVLNISHNKYDEWYNSNLGNPLETLDLSLNFISRLSPAAFRGMSSLKLLNLSENRLDELPDNVFNETYNLETLILSRNRIEHFPRFESASLQVLDLSMCQIASIERDSFAGKSSLLEVDLSKNLIEAIPDLLRSSTLQALDLSYNEIVTINTNTFRALPHLAVLDLSGNEFEDVWTPTYFSENKYLREMYLSGIRWGCDGFRVNLLLMYEYLTRAPPRVHAPDTLICYTPANVTGWSWERAYVLTWHLEGSSSQAFAYTAVLAGLVVGALLTAILCRLRVRRKRRAQEGETPPPARRPPPAVSATTLSGSARSTTATAAAEARAVESVRVPLRPAEDSPPTYDEALMMPRLDGSYHSLPEYLDEGERPRSPAGERLSRSINNLLDPATQADARRQSRATTRRTPATLDP